MFKKYISNILGVSKKKSFSNFDTFSYENFNYEKNASEKDYCSNVVVNRCVNIISQAGSHVPWLIYKQTGSNRIKIENHPIYEILKKPNPFKSGAEFFQELITNKLLFGNAYILFVGDSDYPEIYLLDNSKVQIKTEDGVIKYIYKVGGKEYIYNVDKSDNHSRILHIKNYNPTESLYGISSIHAASRSIELYDNINKWNSALFKNGARPSGALVFKDVNSYLTDEQFERLQQELTDKFSGNNNAHKPLLLEGGLDWKEMSLNPKDTDFLDAKNMAAREIALAFGVPVQLLGVNGDNTYRNMQEARIALWEETLLPLLDKLADSLSNWLSYWFDDNLVIDIDRDSISALVEKRQNLWKKISDAEFMTINEKREVVGLKPIKGGDIIQGLDNKLI